ncbi:uncharacterized protein F4812DRAFT_438847 [Daldinia caldariorum]|uniref:uncharacterized protein n=1 Tax=Daldinia caldariorum TaxID=326644 RepID=UPI002008E26D|nr:uncharacterized protein F4812DRAFT_438847 [Daldinia caldariorum]KAI1465466.1 hypothetical protein F4812DRAFT_438847 [Daldinia caldariorum]
MATSREERMQQRMRGAGRHEVADDSFGFVLPGVEASPAPSPAPSSIPPPSSIARSEPNTSAKRRRLSPKTDLQSFQPPSSALRASRRTSARLSGGSDPYAAIEQESPEGASEPSVAPSPPLQEPQNDATLESIPAVIERPESRGSVASPPSTGHIAEEVTESPAEAPGSGHRRSVRVLPESVTRSAKLLKAVADEEAGATVELTYSSPLARKSRISAATLPASSARSTRTVTRAFGGLALGGIEEQSPAARPARRSDATASTGSARSTRSQTRLATPSIVDALSSSPQAAGTASPKKPQPRVRPKPIVEEPPEIQVQPAEEEPQEEAPEKAAAPNEEAEAIDVQTAARKIGRKRPRASPPREASPELHSRVEDEHERPAKKIRKKKARGSPAVQSHPKPPKEKKKKKDKQPPKRRSDGGAIPIIVQRYTKRMHLNEDDTNGDILNAEIPFSNRGGVNVIDVLSQVCDEVVESSLETLHEAAVKAKDSATKKEFRTKLRALEAFKEELRTRLLEHTIALDTMHALKKRVRSVQKDKLTLRTEIMRIRAEREEVALKMDAVRMRHEAANKETLHQLELSSAMDDIELAIENGKSAPSLNSKEKKAAELSNLELLISRVASQVSGGSDGGGSLKQIKDFNAFLERTAAALERR